MNTTEEAINNQIRHIGHEIRNSLSICDIYSEILKKHLAKNNIKNESMDNAISCIQNAVKLIGNNLLELKSLGEIAQHVCDAGKLIEQTVNMAYVYLKDKNISFECEYPTDVKICVDENKFQACLLNVIKNAIEAIQKNGVIKLSTTIDGEFLVISVSNNGKPISDSVKHTIFDDGFTTKKTGSGVGLYLCKKYLNAQDGDIVLKSSTKDETVFDITVKLFSNT